MNMMWWIARHSPWYRRRIIRAVINREASRRQLRIMNLLIEEDE